MTDNKNSAALDALEWIESQLLDTPRGKSCVETIRTALTKEGAQPEVITAKDLRDKVRRALSLWSNKDGQDSIEAIHLLTHLEWIAYNYPNGLIIRAAQQNMGDE